MNFLRTTAYKDSWYALAAEKRSAATAAAVAYHEKYLKTGKLKDVYLLADGKMMTIWNVSSLEEYFDAVSESPHATFVNSETTPFIDHQAAVKLLNTRREAAKKAAKT